MISSRFYGTENGQKTGYSQKPLTLPDSVQDATEMKKQLPVAQCFVYAADSWMHSGTDKLPPHVLTLTTDRYDDEPADKAHSKSVSRSPSVTVSGGFYSSQPVLRTVTHSTAIKTVHWQPEAGKVRKKQHAGQCRAALSMITKDMPSGRISHTLSMTGGMSVMTVRGRICTPTRTVMTRSAVSIR